VDRQEVARLKEDQRRLEPPYERRLEGEEIAELQQLLRRAGYRIAVDGNFGEQSREALADWQRKSGIPGDGEATFRSLEALRRSLR
jgi:peptidoglycan hydrolase-like protein with peptidoglycan-binding domain